MKSSTSGLGVKDISKYGLHYQSFCDQSENFAFVYSMFRRTCMYEIFEGTDSVLNSPLKHFLQIFQNLEFIPGFN